MKKSIAISLTIALLSGCASIQAPKNKKTPSPPCEGIKCVNVEKMVAKIGTHENLKMAIGADVGTTTLTQLFTQRTELNPIVAGCAKAIGLGPHAGIIVCSVAAGIVAYHIIMRINNPKLTAAAVVIESGMAARNVYVFGH